MSRQLSAFLTFPKNLSGTLYAFSGVIGGAVLAMVSHGADQLIVQRLLAAAACATRRRSSAGESVILQFAFCARRRPLRVLAADAHRTRRLRVVRRDPPTFIVKSLPPFVSAYLEGSSAAMCSSRRRLTRRVGARDGHVAPLMGKKYVEGKAGLVLGKILTLF